MLKLLLKYIWPHKKIFFIALLSGIIYGATSGFLIPVIFQKVFKNFFESSESISNLMVIFTAASIPLFFGIRGLFGFLSTYWMNSCGLEILKGLRRDIFKKLQSLNLAFFDKKTTGDLVNRVITDPNCLQTTILEISSELVKQPFQMISACVALIYLTVKNQDIAFLSIFIVAVPVCFLPVKLLRSRVKKNSRSMQGLEAKMTEKVVENISTVEEIRAFNLEEMQISRLNSAMNEFSESVLRVVKFQKMQQPLMEVISAVLLSVIFIYAYFKKVPFSVFSSMGLALYFAFDPMKRISNTISQIHRSTGALERVNEILESPEVQASLKEKQVGKKLKGEIVFNKVHFQYSKKSKALENVNITISPKTTCALVGPSGAGKSTFLKLIPRFYDITSGNILIDDMDTKSIDIKSLRQNISWVSQQPLLFNDTILNNLKIGSGKASEEEIIRAAKLAHAHEFIEGFPNKYQTLVGEGGGLLSGGQRQRLAIARAFLKNAPILLLDEATSALDSESEFFIRKAIDNLSKEKTVVVIAHRLSTIQHADKILVFQNNKIIGSGKHETLLKENKLYKNLVNKQMLDN